MQERARKLELLPGIYAVCRLDQDAPLPAWGTRDAFFSITRTAEELSVVCLDSLVPDDVTSAGGWRVLMVRGPLAFSLTGVLAALTSPLARAGISIFSLSTFDTDFILVKDVQLEEAIRVLTEEGYMVEESRRVPDE